MPKKQIPQNTSKPQKTRRGKKTTKEIVPIDPFLLAVQEEFKGMTPKFAAWIELFMDETKKETYRNATRCAMATYNTKDYWTAGNIGHENLKKMKRMAAIVAEAKGFGYGEMMDIGMAKMIKGGFGDWERMMERLGYFEPPTKTPDGMPVFNFNNLNVAIMNDRKARGLPTE